MDANQKKWAVWIWIAAAMILAAAFMPWAEIQATPAMPFNGSANGFSPFNPFGNMTVNLTITGWNGTATVAGMSIPNWTTVLLAAAVAGLTWAAMTGAWQPPRFLSPALAILGTLQITLLLEILISSGKASLGIGIFVMAASFAGMVFSAFSLFRQTRPITP